MDVTEEARLAGEVIAEQWMVANQENVKVTDVPHLKEVFAFALSINKVDRLVRALDQASFSTFFGKPSLTVLTKDFAPHSFYFMIYIKGNDQAWVMNGGVIFHQTWRDGEPIPDEGDWSVHT